MSRTTKEINKITGTIIAISGRLIIYALVILLVYEGVATGYKFGHNIFYSTSVSEAPGIDKTVTISDKMSTSDTASLLKNQGLINNTNAFVIQSVFYDYEIKPGTYTINTSMTSKDILRMLDTGEQKETEE